MAAQVSVALQGMRRGGATSVTVKLHPDDLGEVEATVSVQGSELRVHLAAHTAAGHEALTGALGELREDLADHGLSTGSIDLSGPGAGSSGEARNGAQRDSGTQPEPAGWATPAAATATDSRQPRARLAAVPTSSDSHLDIRA